MGQQDVRHYLNGALFDINQGIIKSVATDGHRLAFSSVHEENTKDTQVRVILPRKSILELVRLLDISSEREMTICVGESHFRVVTGDFTFTSKLINAQYPDYDKLIPRSVRKYRCSGPRRLKEGIGRCFHSL